MSQKPNNCTEFNIPLDRDSFMQGMLRDLAGVLQDSIGVQEARGFVSIVGARMGDALNTVYRDAFGQSRLNSDQVIDAMLDLKQRIDGDFYVVSQDETEIVLGNRKCPFGESVRGRPALCMMTSNVFGTIAAENLGYANVVIEKAIARGDTGCRVVVNLVQPDEAPEGREYFGG